MNDAEPIEISVKVIQRSQLDAGIRMACSETNARQIMTDALQESAKQNPTSEEIMLPSSPYLTNAHAPIFQTSLATQYSLPEDLSIGKQPSNTATVRLTTQAVSSLFSGDHKVANNCDDLLLVPSSQIAHELELI